MAPQRSYQEGLLARVAGRIKRDNPYYRYEKMPMSTGEDIPKWQQKVDAWDEGWRAGINQRALDLLDYQDN